MDAFKNMEYGINGVLNVKGKVFRPIIFAKNRCMTKLFSTTIPTLSQDMF